MLSIITATNLFQLIGFISFIKAVSNRTIRSLVMFQLSGAGCLLATGRDLTFSREQHTDQYHGCRYHTEMHQTRSAGGHIAQVQLVADRFRHVHVHFVQAHREDELAQRIDVHVVVRTGPNGERTAIGVVDGAEQIVQGRKTVGGNAGAHRECDLVTGGRDVVDLWENRKII